MVMVAMKAAPDLPC